MNLNILSINVMLAQTWRWLNTTDIRQALMVHAIGAAMLIELQKAHDHLAEHSERRRQLEATLQQLTESVTEHDAMHDRMARAIYGALDAIAQGTRDAQLAHQCIGLQQLLLPEGLGIVSRSYVYEAGAIEALQRRVTPEVLRQLAAIPVGSETLADWYRAWVEAGQSLGRQVQQRAHLLKSTGRGGTGVADIDNRAARRQWTSTVRTFLSALDLMELSQEMRELILSALEASVEAAVRGRADGAPTNQPDVTDDITDDVTDDITDDGAAPGNDDGEGAGLDAAPGDDDGAGLAPDADLGTVPGELLADTPDAPNTDDSAQPA